MMDLTKFVITSVRLACMEIQNLKVVYRNVQPLLLKRITLLTEPLLTESSADKSAPHRNMLLLELDNVLLLAQLVFM